MVIKLNLKNKKLLRLMGSPLLFSYSQSQKSSVINNTMEGKLADVGKSREEQIADEIECWA